MRLFVALDIDDAIRSRISGFLDGVRGFAPDARWTRPESMHVTLKFIGEQPEKRVEEIRSSLESISFGTITIHFRGYGFFPSARSPRVFWIGVEAGPDLAALAAQIDTSLAQLDIPKEEYAYNAHLTLARAAGLRRRQDSNSKRREKHSGSGHSFQHLQEKLAALPAPEFGTMAALEFFLYQSQPSPKGSKYTKLASFSLR
jgi:2'-5' RNA ligase